MVKPITVSTTSTASSTNDIASLKGIGPKSQNLLKSANIETIDQLLFLLPIRYQDRTRITASRDLRDGDWAVIEGEVVKANIIFAKRRQFICQVKDNQGFIKIRFFYFNSGLTDKLTEGTLIRAFGQARLIKTGMEMAHPETIVIDNNIPLEMEERLTPIYPAITGFSQGKIRALIAQALKQYPPSFLEIIPTTAFDVDMRHSLNDCLSYLHSPPPDAPQAALLAHEHPYQVRIALEELTAHHVVMAHIKKRRESKKAYPISMQPTLTANALKALPFQLTNAQQRVIADIETDLGKAHPMYRLVQGDVGSGKTLVAALSALSVLAAGFQVALMAPTEILAEQHFKSITPLLNALGFVTGLLLGKQSAKEKKGILQAIDTGACQFIIGTHAIFQKQVTFHRLAYIIIDEQHRFGVKQRLALKEKGEAMDYRPHELIMSATPIPRSLAQTHFSYLDISTIDELPPGRKPVTTRVLPNHKREVISGRLIDAFEQGKQAYWVCTLIEESEALQCENAETTFETLSNLLPSHRIGLVHGRMKAQEKQDTMLAFKTHQLDLLVATTVIEVGVDVPNASIMVIDNAERFGLSQLHQLRGRVGRGAAQSHCLLLYQAPLSEEAESRLQVMRETNDGFVIANADLKQRGSGEYLGTRQTGFQSYRIATHDMHQTLIDPINHLLSKIMNDKRIVKRLVDRWIGQGQQFYQS